LKNTMSLSSRVDYYKRQLQLINSYQKSRPLLHDAAQLHFCAKRLGSC
jgi:hypothetical protein